MSTSSAARLDTRMETDDFDPIVNHYAPKAEITESIVTGSKVTALCGVRYVVGSQGNGSTAATGRRAVICPLCADIYDGWMN